MQERIETVTAMVYQPDVYHLEVLKKGRNVGAIGLIGSFGKKIVSSAKELNGTIEAGDILEDKRAVLDRLHQTTDLIFDPSAAELMRQIDQIEENEAEGIGNGVNVYELLIAPGTKVKSIVDGISIEALDRETILTLDSKLTPVTRKFFRRYLDYGPEHN